MLYVSGIITLLFFYPVIQWNINNHFATYLYHSSRVNVAEGGFDAGSLLTFIAGQVFYYNPVIFFFIIAASVAAIKNELPVLASQKRLLLFCSIPLLIVTAGIAVFKNVLPHWTGPAYSGLILLTGCYFSKQKEKTAIEKKILPKPLLIATALLFIIIAGGVSAINFLPETLGKKDTAVFGEGDFTLDMYGWNDLKTRFKEILDTDRKTGAMKTDAAIVCNKWFPASHIDVYVAMPLAKDVIAIGDTNEIHQYAWIDTKRKTLHDGDDAYCIVPSNYYVDVKTFYAPYFTTIPAPQIIEQQRNGSVCRYFYIWRLQHFIAKQNPLAQ